LFDRDDVAGLAGGDRVHAQVGHRRHGAGCRHADGDGPADHRSPLCLRTHAAATRRKELMMSETTNVASQSDALVDAFKTLDTASVSDAMDKLGLAAGCLGLTAVPRAADAVRGEGMSKQVPNMPTEQAWA
jgi:hypothetical protein